MKVIFTTLMVLICLVSIKAQIRIQVVQYPNFSTAEQKLFLASDINGWDAASTEFELKKDEKGVYFINLPDTLSYFEYKFTQGAWALAEGNVKGNTRSNRIYDREKEINPKLILVDIENWEKAPGYKFVIKSLPANTPHDASIYIAGNFNNWNPAHPAYKMQKQGDGIYRLLVYSELPRLEYKLTRGNWASVEGRENGKVRPNRVFAKTDIIGNIKDIDIDILSWEDLNGTFNFYSLYDILMLFAVLQGLLFIIAIRGIQDYNQAANRWLLWIMGFVSTLIAIRVIGQERDVAQIYPQIALIPDFIVFIYAPLFYFYIKKLLFKSQKLPYRWAVHFIPALLLLFVYTPYFFTESQVFKLKIVNRDSTMFMVFWIMGIVGFIFNAFYWWLSYKTIRQYRAHYQNRFSYEQNLNYLNTVLIIQATCLVLWFLSGTLWSINRISPVFVNYDITVKCIDAVWFIFSVITYFLGYYAIHQPEVFKIPHEETVYSSIIISPPLEIEAAQENMDKPIDKLPTGTKKNDENTLALAEKVDAFLKKNKTFTNPNLSLTELAGKLKIQPHILSKVINEGFDKNFFDFINGYRIEEFKKLVQDPRHKHHTFISLAYEVGFNSKTAFNRSFKKLNNQTPREYLTQLDGDIEEQ